MKLHRFPARLLGAAALAAGLAAASSGVALAADLDKVHERGALEIAAYRDYPPFSYRDGRKNVGIDLDLGKALADKLGVGLSVRMIGADENMEDDLRNNVWKGHYIGGGTVDVMMHVPYDLDYAEENDLVRFLTPYYREQIALLSHPERAGGVARITELEGLRVGVELDTLADFYLLSGRQGDLQDEVIHFTNLSLAAEALQAGEIDAIFGPQAEFEGILGESLGDYRINYLDTPGLRRNFWDVGLAVRINHKALANEVVQAMTELRESGAIREIFARHGVSYRNPSQSALATGYGQIKP